MVTVGELIDKAEVAIRAGDLDTATARANEARQHAPGDPLVSTLRAHIGRMRGARSDVRTIIDDALSTWFEAAEQGAAGDTGAGVKRSVIFADIVDHGTALHYIDPVELVMTDLPDKPSAWPCFYGLAAATMLPGAEWSPLTPDGALLVHGMGINPRLVRKALGGETTEIDETVVYHPDQRVIVIGTNENWYHFVLDYLPRLLAVLECGLLDAGWKVALGRDASNLFPATLKLLGVPEERVVWLDAARGHHFPRAIYISNMGLRGIPHNFALALLRRYFLPKVIDLDAPPAGPKRLFISRTDTTWRRLADEEQLHGPLQERGFEIIHPARLSMVEQIQMFRSATLVAGVHGSGLVNTVWSAVAPRVIEISPHTARDTHFSNLVKRLGGQHWRLRAGPEETVHAGGNQSDFSIDLTRVIDLIDTVIAGGDV